MVDIAREQAPTLDHLFHYADFTQRAGFDALGLYMEHRFAFDCAPWAQGTGCVTKSMVRRMQEEFPSLTIVPFINLLGHFEGFIYTEEGKAFREDLFSGLQACPSCPEFVGLCEAMIDETITTFQSEVIHIGADEAGQLGNCPRCQERMAGKQGDEKAWLFSEHVGPLARRVLAAGRRPAVWGDMFISHPSALDNLPAETLIFDWQYHKGVAESSRLFTDRGFDVIACPTLHVWNAPWMHVEKSEENLRTVFRDASDRELAGTCLTTWECGLLGAYDTLLPAIFWSRHAMDQPDTGQTIIDAYRSESDSSGEWARIMGVELEKLGGMFAHTGIRSSMKARLLLYGNPFLFWMHHGEELAGDRGSEALKLLEQALFVAPGEAEKGVTLFVRAAIEFARLAEEARREYAEGRPDAAVGKLAPTRYLFETLERVAARTHARIGGSLADIERCRVARRHIEVVCHRLRQYGHRELGYLPAFEVITNPRFMPHDQACWWIVNKWANQ